MLYHAVYVVSRVVLVFVLFVGFVRVVGAVGCRFCGFCGLSWFRTGGCGRAVVGSKLNGLFKRKLYRKIL